MELNWTNWKSKLQEFEKWRTEKRSKIALRYWSFLLEEFLDKLPLSHEKGELCLEIGCGSRVYICSIVKEKLFVGIGLDPICESSLQVLKGKVKRRNLPIHLIKGVGEYLPIKNSMIKIIVITATLDHVQDPDQVMKEVRRVLNREGNLFILQSIVRETKEIFSDRTHLQRFTIKSLQNLLTSNKLALKRAYLFYAFALPFRFPRKFLLVIPRLYNELGKLIHNPTVMIIKAQIKK